MTEHPQPLADDVEGHGYRGPDPVPDDVTGHGIRGPEPVPAGDAPGRSPRRV